MNKLYILILLFVSFELFAQTDDKPFSYQGYAHNDKGDALPSTQINVRFSIYLVGGSVVYQETQTIDTDNKGVFVTTIGEQNTTNFKNLNFNLNNYGMRIEIKQLAEANYVIISDNEFAAVPYVKSASNGAPVGTVVAFGGSLGEIPDGWRLCDGSSVSKTAFSQLYAAIAGAWGESGGNFNLPDMRGMFLRGVSGATNNDPEKNARTAVNAGGNTGNNVGSQQQDAYKSHTHSMNSSGAHTHSLNNEVKKWTRSFEGKDDPDHTLISAGGSEWVRWTTYAGDHTHTINAAGGAETRPKNANVYFIIKY
jgi:microcystin-dependent protein